MMNYVFKWRLALALLSLLTAGCNPSNSVGPSSADLATSLNSNSKLIRASEKNSKLDASLSAIALQYQSSTNALSTTVGSSENTSEDSGEGGTDEETNEIVPQISVPYQREDGKVLVKAYPAVNYNLSAMLVDLHAMGFETVASGEFSTEGFLPASSLEVASQTSSIGAVTAIVATTNSGQYMTEGDMRMRSNELRTTYRATGKGSKIGVISDSFNCKGDMPMDIARGELPSDMQVLAEPNCAIVGTDEGRAMSQIIHDVAPDAKQVFHSGILGGHDAFMAAIDKLIATGARIIADDVMILSEPWFQETVLGRAISERTRSHNITYVAAAGNFGPEFSYAMPFEASTSQPGGNFGLFHKFGRGADQTAFAVVRINPGARASITLQWDQPWRIRQSTQGPMTNMNMFLFNLSGRLLAAAAANNITNGIAYEALTLTNPSQTTPVDLLLAVSLASGPAPSKIQLVLTNGAFFLQSNVKTFSPSILHQANSPHVLAVGASLAVGAQTTPPAINFYSSSGGSPIMFNVFGQPLQPYVLRKPDIVGPDGVTTSFFGVDIDGDGLPNFRGTSAAAPHVAGVVAQLKERLPDARFEFIQQCVNSTATDMDSPITPEFDAGFDYRTGHGYIDAVKAMNEVLLPNQPPYVTLTPGSFSTPLNVVVRINSAIKDDLRPGTSKYALTHKWEIIKGLSAATSADVQIVSADATGVSLKFLRRATYKIKLTAFDSEKSGSMTAAVVAGY